MYRSRRHFVEELAEVLNDLYGTEVGRMAPTLVRILEHWCSDMPNCVFSSRQYRHQADKANSERSDLQRDRSEHADSPAKRIEKNKKNSTSAIDLIISGTSSTLSPEKGQKEAGHALKKWLENAKEVVIIDPYIFKRSSNSDESDDDRATKDSSHISRLVDTVGTVKNITFIYGFAEKKSKIISLGIAEKIANALRKPGFKVKYYCAKNLHDRVWIKTDSAGMTSAKVIGTSWDGIGNRPTYIIDMDDNDLSQYMNYVRYLIQTSEPSHDGRLI